MTNAKSTKKALVASILSLCMCFSMLLGTTFAWFTDSVTSANNIITAGNLDVELEYKKVENGAITDWDTVDGKDNIFDKNALWEPGRVEVVYLKVSNLGTLALKYQLGVNFTETPGVNVAGETLKLSDHLVFKVVEMPDALTTYTDREAVELAAGTEKGIKDYNGITKPLDAKDGTNDEDYVALIVYMPETVGNEANYRGDAIPQITLGINLFATQYNKESDSFGSDYDEEAMHPDFKVTTAGDLQAAINNAKPGDVIEIANDITLNESIVIPAAATTFAMRSTPEPVVINLNGNNITIEVAYDDANATASSAIVNNGTVILTGEGTIKATNNYTVRNYGTMLIDGVTIENGVMNFADLTVDSGNISNNRTGKHTIYGNNATLTINGGTFHNGNPGNATIFSYAGEVVINGGVYTIADGTSTLGWTSCLLDAQGNAKYTINGGEIKGEIRDYNKNTVIYGGTFAHSSVKNFLADGLKAVENNGKYVVVADTVADENVVGTTEELKNALTGAADAGSGDNTIVLAGDVDLTGTTWTPIKVDGYNGAGIVTIEGNGATIKGLTAPLFAGGFAGKSGIVIKNLTIADSEIVSTSGLGGGAFIDTADSMHVITLENCHLVNSTVKGERTGGLIGWCSGYAELNDGPVKAYVTIKNCSVVDSTVIGAGSAGAIAGHPGASDYTYTTIEDCVVKNVDVVSNDTGSWRTGAIVGTANNGHVVINNVTVEDVTLTQNGVKAEKVVLYGRFVPAGTGTLVIDGSSIIEAASFENALKSGDNVNITLPAGEYTMPTPNLP